VGVKNATRLAEALAQREGEMVTRGQLAALLGLQIRMIAYLLAGLVASGQAELTRAGRGLRVARCAIKARGRDVQSGATATPEYRVVTPNTDEQPLQGVHTPPIAPPCPAPAELATPAAEAAPPTPGGVCSPLPAPALDPPLDLAALDLPLNNRAWLRLCKDAPIPPLAPAPPFADDAPAGPGAAFSPNAPAFTPSALDTDPLANWALLCAHWATHVDASDAPRSPDAPAPSALPLPFTATDTAHALADELAVAEAHARALKADAARGRVPWWQYHAAARAVKGLQARMGNQRDAGIAAMLALSPVPPLAVPLDTFHQAALFHQVVNCAD